MDQTGPARGGDPRRGDCRAHLEPEKANAYRAPADPAHAAPGAADAAM